MTKKLAFYFQLAWGLLGPWTFVSDPAEAMQHSAQAILAEETVISERLLAFSALSVGTGTVMLFSPVAWVRDFGVQNVVWGAIDGAIAWWGLQEIARKRDRPLDAREERSNLIRTLWINAGLDVAYIAGGAFLARQPARFGHGVGVMTQGSFLLLFDSYHAWILTPEAQDAPIPHNLD
jgi:hypothetical protein